jgi:hypothetical protein
MTMTTTPTDNNKPAFKPGNKPFLKFGNEVLNNNIPWSEVLNNVLAQPGMTSAKVAAQLGMSINALATIVNGNTCPITFKQGAILLSLSK